MSMLAKSLQLCLTLQPHGLQLARLLCPGVLQARILEQVAVPSARGSSPTQGSNPCLLCLLNWQAGPLSPAPAGKLIIVYQLLMFPPKKCDPFLLTFYWPKTVVWS